VNTKAALGLTAGALAVGLLAGLALGHGSDGSGKIAGPGPTRTVAGVPVGYAHSEDGAVTAAAAYSGTIGALALERSEDRTIAISAMSDPAALGQIRSGLMPGLETLNKGLSTPTTVNAVVRAAPVAYRLVAYNRVNAEVDLWGVGIVGNDDSLPPAATWGITKVRLRWVDGDWKLAANIEQSPGPTPKSNNAPSAPQSFAQSIQDFKGFSHAPAH